MEITPLPIPRQYSIDEINFIKSVCAVHATDQELKLFLYQANKMGLDPLAKQIYFIKYKASSTGAIVVAIDGYRLVAHRTNKYLGGYAIFEEKDGRLIAARFYVKKLCGNQIGEFEGYARWHEYKGASSLWGKMPYVMLSKCAEAQALRKAFPNELSGTYSEDEMDQAKITIEESNDQQKTSRAAISTSIGSSESGKSERQEIIEKQSNQEEIKTLVYEATNDQKKALKNFLIEKGITHEKSWVQFSEFCMGAVIDFETLYKLHMQEIDRELNIAAE